MFDRMDGSIDREARSLPVSAPVHAAQHAPVNVKITQVQLTDFVLRAMRQARDAA